MVASQWLQDDYWKFHPLIERSTCCCCSNVFHLVRSISLFHNNFAINELSPVCEVPLFPTTFRIFNQRKMKKIAVNKYTYFASCIDFFQAPKGQGKIQVMSKMSWCIMLNYQIRGFIFPLVCLFCFFFFVYFKVNFSWVFEIYPAPSCWGWNVSLITDYPSPMGIGKSLHVVDSLIISIS